MTTTMPPEPMRIMGTTEWVSVEWLLRNLTDSADCGNLTRDRGVINLIEDKYDSDLARVLPAVLMDGFTIPIAVSQDYGFTLGNGHHRFVAALLTCADRILVYWSRSSIGCSADDFWHTSSESGESRPSPHYEDEFRKWDGFIRETRYDLY